MESPNATSSPVEPDSRYQYLRCATCGKQYQAISFYGNPHYFLCTNRVPDGNPPTD